MVMVYNLRDGTSKQERPINGDEAEKQQAINYCEQMIKSYQRTATISVHPVLDEKIEQRIFMLQQIKRVLEKETTK